MRGRLINKFIVAIKRLSEEDTDDAQGYDEDFHEPLPIVDGTQFGEDSKRYHDEIRIPCQLDRDEDWGGYKSTRAGLQEKTDIVIALHMPDLERLGLVDTSGVQKFRPGDKIVALYTRAGVTCQVFNDPPGLFVTDIEVAGHGLAAFGVSKQNLVYLKCSYKRTAE